MGEKGQVLILKTIKCLNYFLNLGGLRSKVEKRERLIIQRYQLRWVFHLETSCEFLQNQKYLYVQPNLRIGEQGKGREQFDSGLL